MGVNCSRAAATTSSVIVANETAKFLSGNSRGRTFSSSSISSSTAACSTAASSSQVTRVNNDNSSLLVVQKRLPASPYSSCHSSPSTLDKEQLLLDDVAATPVTTKRSTSVCTDKHDSFISSENQKQRMKEELDDNNKPNNYYRHQPKNYPSLLLLPDQEEDDEVRLKPTNRIRIGNDEKNDQLFLFKKGKDDGCRFDDNTDDFDKSFGSSLLKGMTQHLCKVGYKRVPVVGAAGSPAATSSCRKTHRNQEETSIKLSGRKKTPTRTELSCNTDAAAEKTKKLSQFQLAWQVQLNTKRNRCSSLDNVVESGCLTIVTDFSTAAGNNQTVITSLLPKYIARKLSSGNEKHDSSNTNPEPNALASGEWCEIMSHTFENDTANNNAMLSIKLRSILGNDCDYGTNYQASTCEEKKSSIMHKKNGEDLFFMQSNNNNYKMMIDGERLEFDLIKDEKDTLFSCTTTFADTTEKTNHTDSDNVVPQQEHHLLPSLAQSLQVRNERRENVKLDRTKKACSILMTRCKFLGVRNTKLLQENNELEHQIMILKSKLSEDRTSKEQMVKKQQQQQQQLLQRELQQQWEEDLLLQSQQKLQKQKIIIEMQAKSKEIQYQEDLLLQSQQQLQKQRTVIELQARSRKETQEQFEKWEIVLPQSQLKGGIIQDNAPIITTFEEREDVKTTKKELQKQSKKVSCCGSFVKKDPMQLVQQQKEELENEISNLKPKLKDARIQLLSKAKPKEQQPEDLLQSKDSRISLLQENVSKNEAELDQSNKSCHTLKLGCKSLNLLENQLAIIKKNENSSSDSDNDEKIRNQYYHPSKMEQPIASHTYSLSSSLKVERKSDSFLEQVKETRIRKEVAESRLKKIFRSSIMTKYLAVLSTDRIDEKRHASFQEQLKSNDKELQETKRLLGECRVQNEQLESYVADLESKIDDQNRHYNMSSRIQFENHYLETQSMDSSVQETKAQIEASEVQLKRQFSTGDSSISSLSSDSVPFIVGTTTATTNKRADSVVGKTLTSQVSSSNGDAHIRYNGFKNSLWAECDNRTRLKRSSNSSKCSENYIREKPDENVLRKGFTQTSDFEDLKIVTLSYLQARTCNEKKQLFPIVSAVLKLTTEESKAVMRSIEESSRPIFQKSFSDNSSEETARKISQEGVQSKALFRSTSLSSYLVTSSSPPPTIDTTMSVRRLSKSHPSIISRASSNGRSRDVDAKCRIGFNQNNNSIGERGDRIT